MKYTSHIAIGISVGYITATYLPVNFMEVMELGMYYGSIIIGSLLPDIDEPRSYIGRRAIVLATIINIIFGHRGITHRLWFSLFLGTITYFALGFIPAIGLSMGMILHLMADKFRDQFR